MASGEAAATAQWQADFLRRERLPQSYLATAQQYFDPLVDRILAAVSARNTTLLVGINGSQGSGKTTLCAYLVAALAARQACRAVALSLDDFYLTRSERAELAAAVHPLLRTRGVPGTHDTSLLAATLEALRGQGAAPGDVAVPAFDKARDDRRPERDWPRVGLPVDVVLLEGWCLGARSVDAAALEQPLNALERSEDPEGHWRAFSNDCLREHYEPIYRCIDLWVMLAAPSFEQVLGWRQEQEEKLRAAVGGHGDGLMNPAQLERFVAHFERQTRACLAQLPASVDVLFKLDAARQIASCRGLEGAA